MSLTVKFAVQTFRRWVGGAVRDWMRHRCGIPTPPPRHPRTSHVSPACRSRCSLSLLWRMRLSISLSRAGGRAGGRGRSLSVAHCVQWRVVKVVCVCVCGGEVVAPISMGNTDRKSFQKLTHAASASRTPHAFGGTQPRRLCPCPHRELRRGRRGDRRDLARRTRRADQVPLPAQLAVSDQALLAVGLDLRSGSWELGWRRSPPPPPLPPFLFWRSFYGVHVCGSIHLDRARLL